MLKKIMLTSLTSLLTLSASAQTFLNRNYNIYTLATGDSTHALLVVTTVPAEPNQPVYAWRTHKKHDGTPGALSQNASFIGYTDSRGIFISEVKRLPIQEVYCGIYTNEQVAVGSPYAPKSNSLNFEVRYGLDFSPSRPIPWRDSCQPH